MGIRSINNSSAAFRDRFFRTGLDAVNPYSVPPPEAQGGNNTYNYTYNSVSYRIHKFTGSGTWTLLNGNLDVDILVLGGGGSGGGGNNSNHGAGGGAGGILWRPLKTLTPGSYTVTVGGVATWSNSGTEGTKGNNSVFTGNGYTLTGNGGGGGSGTGNSTQNDANMAGGSGGGAGRDAGNRAGGVSNQNNNEDGSATAYGTNGGVATGTGCTSAGGGGGAGDAGDNGCYDCQSSRSGTCSNGGDGIQTLAGMNTAETKQFFWECRAGTDGTGTTGGTACTSLGSIPSNIYLAGGGAGAYEHSNVGQMADGGKGGGGRGGSRYGPIAGTHAIANTGSGGGAGQKYASGGDGGNGAAGLVLIRYNTNQL